MKIFKILKEFLEELLLLNDSYEKCQEDVYTYPNGTRRMTSRGFSKAHKKIMKKLKENPIKIPSDK